MASIGSLTADLKLQSAAFIRDMTKAARNVETNTAKMRKSMRQVEQASRAVNKSFAQLKAGAAALAGALAVRQFATFTKAAIQNADAIAKQADRIGISTRALQEYRTVAGLAGVETSRLDQGLGAFVKRLGELRAGTGALATLLNKSNEELRNQLVAAKSSEEALRIFLKALGETANQADRVALSAAAFSRTAGIEMANLVKNGADSVETLRASLVDLGLIMDEGTLRAAERLNDQFGLLKQSFQTGFDTAIIQGLTGSIDDSAESLKEARRLGEEFGRVVGAAMRGLIEATKFIGRNIDIIVASLGALIALKAAGVIIELAITFTKLALALRAAAAAGGLLAVATAGAKKGLLTLGVATAAFIALSKELKNTETTIKDALDGLKGIDTEAAGAGQEVATFSKKVSQSTAELKKSADQSRRLTEALRISRDEYERVKTAIDLENEAAKENIDLTTEQGRAWRRAFLAAREAAQEFEKTEKTLEETNRRTKRDIEEQKRLIAEQRELMLEPFKNAIRGVQDSFTEMFENVFSGGVNSFTDLADSVKRIFVRLAAEIASLMVIRPILGNIAGGGLGQQLGIGGGSSFNLGNTFGGSGNLFSGIGNTVSGWFGGSQAVPDEAFWTSSGATNATSGLSGFASSIPVWGWITAAAIAGKQISQQIGGPFGNAASALLLPSIEEWQANPVASFGNTIDPFGTAASRAGLPRELSLLLGPGALFQSSPSVGPNGGFNFGATNGRFAIQGSGGDNGFNPADISQQANTAVTAFNQLLDQLGATLVSAPYSVFQMFGGAFRSGVGGEGRSFGTNAEAAVENLILEVIRKSTLGGLSPEVQTALENSTATTIQQLVDDLMFASEFAKSAGSSLSVFEQSVNAVNARFDDLTARALSLGLSIEQVELARQRELATLRFQAQLPFLAAAESIAGFVRGNRATFLSPAEQLKASQADFQTLLARVRGGEIGLTNNLLQSAQQVIGLGRQNFASTVDFANVERFVQSSLLGVADTLTSEAFIDQQLEATRQQTEELSGDLDDLKDELRGLRQELRLLGERIAA